EDPTVPEEARKGRERWERAAKASFDRTAPRKRGFTTVSGAPVNALAGPDTLAGFDSERDLGWPGEYPFTRGVQPTMYRGKLWTIRQFAGYGTARQTNQRFHYLLEHGQTGLSTAFHLPTLYGYDSDHEMAKGEVGKCGVAVDSLRDMEVLFDGIDLGKVTTSMTINSTAPIALAMYLAVAEKHGTPWEEVGGTLQNDILKEYIAQKEYIFPPRPSMRLVTDQLSFCAKHVPRWNTISISGYHIREAGSTALQELAFTLRDGVEYVQYGIEAGLPVDEFAPRLSFFFNSHNDFFEEVAKFRAIRRMWSQWVRDQLGVADERCQRFRFHTQTSGATSVARFAHVNIARSAIQALAAVMGGT
ncbi:MAG: acyl-CoA mutase large subunit family protein, partial [Rubrobacteraceae bacterium]